MLPRCADHRTGNLCDNPLNLTRRSPAPTAGASVGFRAAIGIAVCAVWINTAAVGAVHAAPRAAGPATSNAEARARYQAATQLIGNGAHEEALVVIEDGLRISPRDLLLLRLKGSVLMTLHDLPAALAAYQAYLAAGATGAKKRQVEGLVKELRPILTTFLEVTVSNGPAQIYVPFVSKAVFCTAAPSCKVPVLPRAYQVIAERTGFERWTGRAAVVSGQTTALTVTLVERPSQLIVRVTPAGARVTVDDAPYEADTKVAGGAHLIVASLAGHADERRQIDAHEGKPVEMDLTLTPVVPFRVTPAGATLLLDGKPAEIRDGRLEMPAGAHALVARAHGFQDATTAVPAKRPADYAIVVALAPEVATVAAPVTPRRFTGRRKLALAAAGAGLLAVSAATVMGVQARQMDRETYTLCTSPSIPCSRAAAANDENQQARSRALTANVAFAVAGAAAIGAAVLWFTGTPDSGFAVTPSLGPVAGLDLVGRF